MLMLWHRFRVETLMPPQPLHRYFQQSKWGANVRNDKNPSSAQSLLLLRNRALLHQELVQVFRVTN
jgi:hypothetical protein